MKWDPLEQAEMYPDYEYGADLIRDLAAEVKRLTAERDAAYRVIRELNDDDWSDYGWLRAEAEAYRRATK